MPQRRAVLFDFFGTLTRAVRRGPSHVMVARILGCDHAAMVAALDRSYYARACGDLGSAEESLRWVAHQAGGHPTDDAVKAAVEVRMRAMREDTRLRYEAVPTLRELRRRGLRTAVVSDCTHELPAFLPRLPVDPLLDTAVYSIEVGRCKPSPAMYGTACDRLGVAPHECLYVGDGGSNELTGAVDAGMAAVRLTAPDLGGHLVFGADEGWQGPSAESLLDTLWLVDRIPMPGPVPA
jgi:putative hydrolase of the HAD superfamily